MLPAIIPRTARPALLAATSLFIALQSAPALAGPEDFGAGPLIADYGQIAAVDMTSALPDNSVFQIAFDSATRSDTDSLNRTLTSAARFLNMHVANGVEAGNLHLAIVIHGGAVHDVAGESAAGNADLVATLLTHGVRVIVCGQSAAYYDVSREDLLPGVEMALSAMTAHALLQQDGYTLNPF
ncbi:DsrE family protein [uncultured Maricaulis sp.]|uniref:DsrE family protein n=1 Tax=uncultured Maricaulis sp. TaxID=174710 RepID=UPI002602ACB2|nr:DsrE family protein [uncultured Maricaulis sp.]